jgi:hypothetical protein
MKTFIIESDILTRSQRITIHEEVENLGGAVGVVEGEWFPYKEPAALDHAGKQYVAFSRYHDGSPIATETVYELTPVSKTPNRG